MRVAVASDHAGFELKTAIVEHLKGAGHEVLDLGTDSPAPVDYPAFCAACARAVVAGDAELGVVVGGSGQGEQISANKVHGARAALCHDEYTARLARQHNNANVLSIGARVTAEVLALILVDTFLATPFEGGRHVARLEQIAAIEAEECAPSA
ncbi:ribose-5-phosphate isomerase [Acidiferrimicrobium sp. IK]|uniref:ribose-5-phosphate isomerase n=1 Tax=Acidiferrimicrobium sp. IK TaxID=2871700 RepID=UPI0021CB71B6|nr:ribose-5-phosphate isomerase [Acidiferrimicrobium sp. IK]MCU4185422.1 ribose-5-phosphate isomerase [Acidiferrimicrobium sp. IK]